MASVLLSPFPIPCAPLSSGRARSSIAAAREFHFRLVKNLELLHRLAALLEPGLDSIPCREPWVTRLAISLDASRPYSRSVAQWRSTELARSTVAGLLLPSLFVGFGQAKRP
jgi:hypothetical protein